MFMIIRYSDGSYVEGVIHRLERGILRATVAGIDDAVEFILQREVDVVMGMMRAGEPGCAAGGDCILRRMPGTGPVLVN